jgi:hypothetical protein
MAFISAQSPACDYSLPVLISCLAPDFRGAFLQLKEKGTAIMEINLSQFKKSSKVFGFTEFAANPSKLGPGRAWKKQKKRIHAGEPLFKKLRLSHQSESDSFEWAEWPSSSLWSEYDVQFQLLRLPSKTSANCHSPIRRNTILVEMWQWGDRNWN